MNNENKRYLLDHGFVKLLNLSGPVRRNFSDGICLSDFPLKDQDKYGDCSVWQEDFKPFDADDTDPALTARISFNNFDKERSREQDLRLVEYLMKNKHNSPLEMIEAWFELKVPIFIARQIHRHRVFVYNEVSARYSVLPEEWYIPKVVGGKPTNGMKQGQENNLTHLEQVVFITQLDEHCKNGYKLYSEAIVAGIAPEHARLFLHVNHYTHFIMKGNLHNWMNFLTLRLDKHAQIEARIYAQAIYDLLKQYLPETMKLFDKHRRLVPQSGKPREVLVKEIANTKFSELSEDELNSIYAILGK